VKRITGILLLISLCIISLSAQTMQPSLEKGKNLYAGAMWNEAVIELRRFLGRQPSYEEKTEALYWLSLSELAIGDYESALQDLEILIKSRPENERTHDAIYQKGRVLYHLGRYDEAIIVLKAYIDSTIDSLKVSMAMYWMAESLFAMGNLTDAHSLFLMIVEKYPNSAKYEAAAYRIALIEQKKIEAELLALLKWSHEESLKTIEEYQRRERSYEQAIIAYQKRIADMLKDTRLAELEAENKRLAEQAKSLEQRLDVELARMRNIQGSVLPLSTQGNSSLPLSANTTNSTTNSEPSNSSSSVDSEQISRIEELRKEALAIQDALSRRLSESSTGDTQQ
jgi:TolA-binding protein